MPDVFELCRSERFLAGGPSAAERSFEFPGQRPWQWRVTSADEYLEAIRRDLDDEDGERKTPWHVLEERYLAEHVGIVSKIRSLGAGPAVKAIWDRRVKLSNLLATDTRIRDVAEQIAAHGGIDAERLLGESLGEMPYGHLSAAASLQQLLPDVEFPFITVLLDAYGEGLLPYGVFDQSLDPNYVGPEVLLCVDPANLGG
ncbi:hypothetical protein Mal4_35060 [Maioricimonas rarisocia]|uniref:Uncharacterized protein n=1 Tax=Maioricimonas rarisocia TaxID=2528026 RepID=A0A517Z9R5_9PLAN|nr:hypothetical protein [Maioricimonas rarisocia]QDU39170.1 hypothetical protein Mal4_35060 [Maioricimonas rarisocia]